MIITTTSNIEGRTIKEYRGVVFGEAISGIDFMKDFSASFTNMMGGRATEYENELVAARADAINEMITRAKKIGANALIGMHVDVEEITNMILVSASATAVVVE